MTDTYFFGLDLGQMADYSALSIAHRITEMQRTGRYRYGVEPIMKEVLKEYQLVHLERFPLGTPYRDIAMEVKRLQGELARTLDRHEVKTYVAVDATGVGRPVTEMLEQAGVKPLYAITITAGNAPQHVRHREWHVPKRDLVSTAQVLLQNRKLAIASGLRYAETLRRELETFKVKINIATGHDSYEAHREGDHDDLVLSLTLAVWLAEHGGIQDWSRLRAVKVH